MSTKISDLTALTPPLAADDLIAVVDTGAAATKSVRADQSEPYIKTTLSTGQILVLNGTPIEVVPAPGAGKIAVPTKIGLSITYNSIAYTTNVQLQFNHETSGFAFLIDSVMLLKTSDLITIVSGFSWGTTVGMLENKKIEITVGTGNPTAGNSPLDVYVWYQILTL